MRPTCAWCLNVVACLGVTALANSASATLVVDQVADAFNAPSPSGELGGPTVADFQTALQTFTVGVGGSLAGIELQVQQSGAPSVPDGDLVLTLLGTAAGVPDFAQDQGSVSLPASSIPPFDNFTSGPFTSFDVSGLGISVAPGDVLAFAVSYPTGSGSYFIYDSETDVYSSGTSYIFGPLDGAFFEVPTRDLGFRTTVVIPEPQCFAVVTLVGLVSGARRRRR